MTQANLQQFAMSQGIRKNIADMTQAEQVALRYKFVTNALSLASGDLPRPRTAGPTKHAFFPCSGRNLCRSLVRRYHGASASGAILNTLVAALIKMANTFNAVISSIFGGAAKQIKDTGAAAAQANAALGSSAGAAADGENELADSD